MKKFGSFSTIAIVLALIIGLVLSPASAIAQEQRTVGDGTLFLFSPGKSENYGINSGDIGGSSIGEPLYSRKSFADSTGIGSSTIQTTSPTGLSSTYRAAVQTFSPSVTSSSAIQSLQWTSQPLSTNPALSGYTVSPTSGLGVTGAGFSSPALSSYSPFASAGLYQDMQAVPSFNKHSSKHAFMSLTGGDEGFFKKVTPQF